MKKALIFGLVITSLNTQILPMDLEKKVVSLCAAAIKGDIKQVEAYADKCTINAKSPRGDTSLFFAIQGACNYECIKHLLSVGARVNAQDEAGCTLLHWLVMKKDVEDHIQLLLDRGADMSIFAKGDISVLHFLAQTRQLASLQVLLKNGAKKYINLQDTVGGNSPLHTTLLYYNQGIPFKKSHIRVDVEEDKEQQNLFIQLLLDSGADLFLRNSTSQTPYTIAEANPHLKRMLNRHIKKQKEDKVQSPKAPKKNRKKRKRKKKKSEKQNIVPELKASDLVPKDYYVPGVPTGPTMSDLILLTFLQKAEQEYSENV